MSALATAAVPPRTRKHKRRNHVVPIAVAGIIASAALAAIGYLLWPTYNFSAATANDPTRLPVSVGGTLFNVPPQAIRVKVQRHSGPQERVDLSFGYPSLDPSQPIRRVTAEEADAALPPIDRLFVSIAAHHDALAPEARARTIYPRYFERSAAPPQDGLSTRSFIEGSPYSSEDLVFANSPPLVTRCTRDGATPGTCISDVRVGGADITFRFPRAWLSQWRDVAAAMEQLASDMTTPHKP